MFRTRVSKPGLDRIRQIVPFDLPPETALLDSYQEYSREVVLVARLSLSRAAVQQLLKGLPAGSEVSSSGVMGRPALSALPAWWAPEAAPQFLHVWLKPTHTRGTGELLVSAAGRDRAVAFLRWESL